MKSRNHVLSRRSALTAAALAGGASLVPTAAAHADGAVSKIHGTVMSHFAAAYAASGTQWYWLYNMLAPRIENSSAGKIAAPPNVREDSIEQARAARVFDNLYYVGEKDAWESSPGAWAIDTPDGIIVLDALNPDSGPILIERGLQEFGLDPSRIKYVVVSHAHRDHFGGARYLQEKYDPRVAMSTEDWDYMESTTPAEQRPVRDMELKDGQALTLGGETVRFYVTPGHTPGTLSFHFPVYDHGVRHVAAQWGGTGFGFGGAEGREKQRWFEIYHASATRFRRLAAAAHADVLIANHPVLDNTYANIAALDARQPGDPNPWVVGEDSVRGYITTAAECAAAGAVAGLSRAE
jgi:metallo-beta-lactamase class B